MQEALYGCDIVEMMASDLSINAIYNFIYFATNNLYGPFVYINIYYILIICIGNGNNLIYFCYNCNLYVPFNIIGVH